MSDRTIQAHMGVNISGIKARAGFDHGHYEIHQGKSYSIEVNDETMGDNDFFAIGFKTPLTKEINLFLNFTAKAQTNLQLLENADWSGGKTGTQLDVFNRNRNSPNICSLLTDYSVSGSWQASGNVHSDMSGLDGTVIFQDIVYGTKQAGNIARGEHEVILKTGTIYAIKFLAQAGSNGGQMIANFYEEDV